MRSTSHAGAATLGAVVILILLGALFAAGCSRTPGPAGESCEITPPLEVGHKVGDMVLPSASGGPTRISTLIEGKVALIDVWATWCQPCLIALPHLEKLHAEYGDKGFTVVGVLVDGNANKIGPSFVEKKDIDYPVLLDDEGQRFMCDWGEFLAVPHMLIVDRDGTVLDVFSGMGDLTVVDRRLEEILGEPLAEAASRVL
ncbi:MAG: TlpA family protein disulfide reductase [Acidobacteriota bacterium]|nr:TlpA family protein disulfide reductase [Acidobacteriota bacterium]